MRKIRRKYRLLNLFIVGVFVILGCNLCAPPGSPQSAEETARVKALMYTPLTPTQTPTSSQTPTQVTPTPTPSPSPTSTPQAAQPQLTVTVSVSQMGYTKTGEVIVYTFTVQNTGGAAVNGPFELVDKKADQWKCEPVDSLLVGGQLICKGYYRIRKDDLCSSVTNVAHVDGTFQGEPIKSNQASVTVYSGRNCNKPKSNEPGPTGPISTPCPLTSC